MELNSFALGIVDKYVLQRFDIEEPIITVHGICRKAAEMTENVTRSLIQCVQAWVQKLDEDLNYTDGPYWRYDVKQTVLAVIHIGGLNKIMYMKYWTSSKNSVTVN